MGGARWESDVDGSGEKGVVNSKVPAVKMVQAKIMPQEGRRAMQYRTVRIIGIALMFIVVISFVLTACSSPTPQAPQIVKETQVVQQTVIVAGTPQVIEKVVTVTPSPATPVPTQSTGPKRGGTMTILVGEEFKGLNNLIDSGTEGEYPEEQFSEALVQATMDRKLVPGLATSWDISPDGLTYTFHLRQGVKYHDGTPFNADSVKWEFDKVIEPGSYSGGKWIPYIAGSKVIDPYTISVTLKQPWYDFLNELAFDEDMNPISPTAYQKWGQDYGFKAAVGTGPYMFDHWTRGTELVLVRNPDYWGKDAQGNQLPYIDKLIYRPALEDSVKMIQLATQNADAIFAVPRTQVKALKTDSGIVVDSVPAGTVDYLAFVTDYGPFKDKKVRQALSYAINRQEIVDTIFGGQAAVANSIFPPILFVSTNDKVVYDYNPDKAKAMLAEAGYGPNNPLKFLMLTSNAQPYNDEAVLVQAQLKKIGVQADVQQLEKAALSTYTSGTAPDAKDKRQSFVYRYGYDGTFINDYTYRSFYSTGSLNNFAYNKVGGAQNPVVDKLMLDALLLMDKDQIKTTNQKINDLLLDDAPWVWIAFENNIDAWRSYVKGLHAWTLNLMPMKEVWLDKPSQ
jgi:peptide/nickel transport system substrate-binding protein